MKNIERFIIENRTKFKDEFKAPKTIWEQIELELDSDSKRGKFNIVRMLYPILGVAASVAVLIFAFIGVKHQFGGVDVLEDPEIVGVTTFYGQMISNRYDQAQESISPDLKADFLDLRDIQASILEELEEAPESVRPKLIEALRINYENQLEVLESFEERNIKETSIKSNYDESQNL